MKLVDSLKRGAPRRPASCGGEPISFAGPMPLDIKPYLHPALTAGVSNDSQGGLSTVAESRFFSRQGTRRLARRRAGDRLPNYVRGGAVLLVTPTWSRQCLLSGVFFSDMGGSLKQRVRVEWNSLHDLALGRVRSSNRRIHHTEYRRQHQSRKVSRYSLALTRVGILE